MAEVDATFNYDADFSSAISEVQKLAREVGFLNAQFNAFDQASINAKRQFSNLFKGGVGEFAGLRVEAVNLSHGIEDFGKALEKSKLKLRDYAKEARMAFKENSNARKLAEDQIRRTRATLIELGMDPSGRRRGMLVTPMTLDMSDMQTQLEVARKQWDIFNKLVQDGSTHLINWGKNTQWAGRQLTVGLTVPMTMFASTTVKAFNDVDAELTRFQKVYGSSLVQTTTAATEAIRAQVQAVAIDIAKTYGIAAKETAALSADLAATGLEGQKLVDSVRQTTRLAVLGELDRQDAMKTTLSLQNAFNMSTKQLAESIDFLNAVENQTSVSLGDLSEAIPKVGPVVRALGGDVKDLSVLLVAMKEGGINAAEGANALKSGLASLINPTKNASEVAKQYGIDLESIVNKNKGKLLPTILEFQNGLMKLDELGKAKVIEQIFGKYQFARISALFDNLNQQGSQTRQVIELMGKSSKELAAIANSELKVLTESTSMKFKRSLEGIKASLLPLGEAIAKSVIPFMDKLTTLLDKLVSFGQSLPGPVKSFLKFAAGVTAIAGPLIMITGVLGNFLGYIVKGAMAFVNLGRKMAGLPVQQFEMLSADQIAAAKATDNLTISIERQKQSMIGLRDVLIQYSQTLASVMTEQAGLFQTGATPVMPPGTTEIIPPSPRPRPKRRQLGGPIFRAQDGATVPGYGEGDKVSALLEPGEFVINKKAAKKHKKTLEYINNVDAPRFSTGGSTYRIGNEGDILHAMAGRPVPRNRFSEAADAISMQAARAKETSQRKLPKGGVGRFARLETEFKGASVQSSHIIDQQLFIRMARRAGLEIPANTESIMTQGFYGQAAPLSGAVNSVVSAIESSMAGTRVSWSTRERRLARRGYPTSASEARDFLAMVDKLEKSGSVNSGIPDARAELMRIASGETDPIRQIAAGLSSTNVPASVVAQIKANPRQYQHILINHLIDKYRSGDLRLFALPRGASSAYRGPEDWLKNPLAGMKQGIGKNEQLHMSRAQEMGFELQRGGFPIRAMAGYVQGTASAFDPEKLLRIKYLTSNLGGHDAIDYKAEYLASLYDRYVSGNISERQFRRAYDVAKNINDESQFRKFYKRTVKGHVAAPTDTYHPGIMLRQSVEMNKLLAAPNPNVTAQQIYDDFIKLERSGRYPTSLLRVAKIQSGLPGNPLTAYKNLLEELQKNPGRVFTSRHDFENFAFDIMRTPLGRLGEVLYSIGETRGGPNSSSIKYGAENLPVNRRNIFEADLLALANIEKAPKPGPRVASPQELERLATRFKVRRQNGGIIHAMSGIGPEALQKKWISMSGMRDIRNNPAEYGALWKSVSQQISDPTRLFRGTVINPLVPEILPEQAIKIIQAIKSGNLESLIGQQLDFRGIHSWTTEPNNTWGSVGKFITMSQGRYFDTSKLSPTMAAIAQSIMKQEGIKIGKHGYAPAAFSFDTGSKTRGKSIKGISPIDEWLLTSPSGIISSVGQYQERGRSSYPLINVSGHQSGGAIRAALGRSVGPFRISSSSSLADFEAMLKELGSFGILDTKTSHAAKFNTQNLSLMIPGGQTQAGLIRGVSSKGIQQYKSNKVSDPLYTLASIFATDPAAAHSLISSTLGFHALSASASSMPIRPDTDLSSFSLAMANKLSSRISGLSLPGLPSAPTNNSTFRPNATSLSVIEAFSKLTNNSFDKGFSSIGKLLLPGQIDAFGQVTRNILRSGSLPERKQATKMLEEIMAMSPQSAAEYLGISQRQQSGGVIRAMAGKKMPHLPEGHWGHDLTSSTVMTTRINQESTLRRLGLTVPQANKYMDLLIQRVLETQDGTLADVRKRASALEPDILAETAKAFGLTDSEIKASIEERAAAIQSRGRLGGKYGIYRNTRWMGNEEVLKLEEQIISSLIAHGYSEEQAKVYAKNFLEDSSYGADMQSRVNKLTKEKDFVELRKDFFDPEYGRKKAKRIWEERNGIKPRRQSGGILRAAYGISTGAPRGLRPINILEGQASQDPAKFMELLSRFQEDITGKVLFRPRGTPDKFSAFELTLMSGIDKTGTFYDRQSMHSLPGGIFLDVTNNNRGTLTLDRLFSTRGNEANVLQMIALAQMIAQENLMGNLTPSSSLTPYSARLASRLGMQSKATSRGSGRDYFHEMIYGGIRNFTRNPGGILDLPDRRTALEIAKPFLGRQSGGIIRAQEGLTQSQLMQEVAGINHHWQYVHPLQDRQAQIQSGIHGAAYGRFDNPWQDERVFRKEYYGNEAGSATNTLRSILIGHGSEALFATLARLGYETTGGFTGLAAPQMMMQADPFSQSGYSTVSRAMNVFPGEISDPVVRARAMLTSMLLGNEDVHSENLLYASSHRVAGMAPTQLDWGQTIFTSPDAQMQGIQELQKQIYRSDLKNALTIGPGAGLFNPALTMEQKQSHLMDAMSVLANPSLIERAISESAGPLAPQLYSALESMIQEFGHVKTDPARYISHMIRHRGNNAIKFRVLQQGGSPGFDAASAWVPGSGEGDKIPALLEPGEFVVNKVAAKKHGGMLDYINYVDAPRFQSGGIIRAQSGYTESPSGVPGITRRTYPSGAPDRYYELDASGKNRRVINSEYHQRLLQHNQQQQEAPRMPGMPGMAAGALSGAFMSASFGISSFAPVNGFTEALNKAITALSIFTGILSAIQTLGAKSNNKIGDALSSLTTPKPGSAAERVSRRSAARMRYARMAFSEARDIGGIRGAGRALTGTRVAASAGINALKAGTMALLTNPVGWATLAIAGTLIALKKYKDHLDDAKKAAHQAFTVGKEEAAAYGVELRSMSDAMKENVDLNKQLGITKDSVARAGIMDPEKAKAVTDSNKEMIKSMKNLGEVGLKSTVDFFRTGKTQGQAQGEQTQMLLSKYGALLSQGFSSQDAQEAVFTIAKAAGAMDAFARASEQFKNISLDKPETIIKTQMELAKSYKNMSLFSGDKGALGQGIKDVVASLSQIPAQGQYKAAEEFINSIQNLDTKQLQIAQQSMYDMAQQDFGKGAGITKLLKSVQEQTKGFSSWLNPTSWDNLNSQVFDEKKATKFSATISAAYQQGILSDAQLQSYEARIKADPASLDDLQNQVDAALAERDRIIKVKLEFDKTADINIEQINKEVQANQKAFQEAMDANQKLADKENDRYANAQKKHQNFIKQKQKEVDAINKGADEYTKSLQKQEQADAFYANQRQTTLGGLQALAGGDVLGFLQAREQAAAQAQQFGYQSEIDQINAKRDAAVQAKQDEIDKEQELADKEDERHAKIMKNLEDKATSIQEKYTKLINDGQTAAAAWENAKGNTDLTNFLASNVKEADRMAFTSSYVNYLINHPEATSADALNYAKSSWGEKNKADLERIQETEKETKALTRASGGYVSGPGGPKEDKIPAMLSNGEYVIQANAVSSIGKGQLDYINETGTIPYGGKEDSAKEESIYEKIRRRIFNKPYPPIGSKDYYPSGGKHSSRYAHPVDYLAASGTPVLALMSGTAINRTMRGSFGKHVILSGSEGTAIYAHLSKFGKKGAVNAGETIGYVGNTGHSFGAHLHFEWSRLAGSKPGALDTLSSITTLTKDEIIAMAEQAGGLAPGTYNNVVKNGLVALPITSFGARANGGSMTRNKPYLVGENGPEVVMPYGSGGMVKPVRYSVPNSDSAIPVIDSSQSNAYVDSSTNSVYNINVDASGSSSPRDIANAVMSAIRTEESRRSFGRGIN